MREYLLPTARAPQLDGGGPILYDMCIDRQREQIHHRIHV